MRGRRLSARCKSAAFRFFGVHKQTRFRVSFCLSHSSDFQGLKTSRGSNAVRARRETSTGGAIPRSIRGPGDVAQLGEHLLCKQGVSGSNPLISTSTLTTELVYGDLRTAKGHIRILFLCCRYSKYWSTTAE